VALCGKLSHAGLYKPGGLTMEVEHIVAEGPLVAIQFTLCAITARGEPYENYYYHLFECHNGKITKQGEYCDTLYGTRMLQPDTIGDASV
jgi:ketosteroid isomerase-like protein